MLSAHFVLHLISGRFPTHCYCFGTLKKKKSPYFPHLVLLVSSSANSAPLCKTPCLNEIGYGNVKCCRPVVSADVVELGSGTYPSEKQTRSHQYINRTHVRTLGLI